MKAPVALALDAPNDEVAIEWARAVEPYITTAKIGLELFVRYGPQIVHSIRQAAPTLDIFLDLKLHDIPNTVAGAAKAAAPLSPTILTVHASGSSAMIASASAALPDTKIAAVTVLTSMDDEELKQLNVSRTAAEQAMHLALLAVHAGARAIVCSPQEVKQLREALPAEITLITPGVRPSGSSHDDQSRIATPQQALADGADLLVIGRPITSGYSTGGTAAVAKAAAAIAESIR